MRTRPLLERPLNRQEIHDEKSRTLSCHDPPGLHPLAHPETADSCGKLFVAKLSGMAIPSAEILESILAPVVASLNLDIEGVKVVRAGRKSQVIVLVDGDVRPDLDTIEEVTREISQAFDAAEARGDADFGTQEYTLEVSTPGIDAPLTAPRHWKRNRNRLVQVRLADGAQIVGRIGALNDSDDSVILVTTSGTKGRKKAHLSVLELETVGQAVVQVEFSDVPEAEAELSGLEFDDAVSRLED